MKPEVLIMTIEESSSRNLKQTILNYYHKANSRKVLRTLQMDGVRSFRPVSASCTISEEGGGDYLLSFYIQNDEGT